MSFDASRPEHDPVYGDERILDLVIDDFNTRAAAGYKKYGTYLMSHNGRNALLDAYQEAIDLVMYLRQLIIEMGYDVNEQE